MGRVVEAFPKLPGHGNEAKYPWDEWFDGRVWQLERGVDWAEEREPRSFCRQVDTKARERRLMLKTRTSPDKRRLWIQARRDPLYHA